MLVHFGSSVHKLNSNIIENKLVENVQNKQWDYFNQIFGYRSKQIIWHGEFMFHLQQKY